MKFNDLHKLLDSSIMNEGLMDFIHKLMDIAKAIVPEEYYMYPGMKEFEENMRVRLEARNEQNYEEKWSEHKKKESYDTMEEACQAMDQSLQSKARKKFSDWFMGKMQNIYMDNNINITTKNPKDTINNSYIMFGADVNPMIGISALSDPGVKALLDKFFIDYNQIDKNHFDLDLITDPTKSGAKNWMYNKSEIQKLAGATIKNMVSTSSVDDKIFAQSLTLCFSSVKDDGGSTSFLSNLDFVIMASILSAVFPAAYKQYLTTSKLKKLEALCNSSKADYDVVSNPVAPTPGAADPRLKSAEKILTDFTSLITDLKSRSTPLSDKLYDQYDANKKLTTLTEIIRKINSSLNKAKSFDKNKIVNAKAAWDLGFELYSVVKVEEEKLSKLDKVFSDLAIQLASFPKLVDQADIAASQNFIIPKIKKS